MPESTLNKFIHTLTHMHVSHSSGYKAPHKAILMITVAELIRDNRVNSPVVPIDELLNNLFFINWFKYIQIQTSFRCKIEMPLSHLKSETFIKCVDSNSFELDSALYNLFRDSDTSEILIANIISTYLAPFANNHKVDFNQLNPYRDTTLRKYQIVSKEKIYKMWTQLRSIMFQMPTGTGKTKLFVSIARDIFDWGADRKIPIKILFLAHRTELIEQISNNLGLKYNLAHGIIASKHLEQRSYTLQVGSVPTLSRRLNRWEDKDFDIIIVDEAHHVKADSYKKILKTFPRAKVLGVTATPYRLNGESFRPEFDDLITSPSVSKFIKAHWLCDYDYYSIKPHSRLQIDINSIREFALDGDFLDRASMSIMDTHEIRAQIVSTYEKIAKGKKGIVYTINTVHNNNVCQQFISRGYKAVAIDAQTPSEERAKMVEDFRKGAIDIICNVNIFSEGFDCPDVEFIQLTRPTKSLSLYLQQVGRGLRPAEGKDKLLILDNVGLYNKFGFPSARRQWRHHFEGRNTDLDVLFESRNIDGREIMYIEDYAEGDEEVEMLHSSATDEPVEITEAAPDSQFETTQNNEAEFRYFLKQKKFTDHQISNTITEISTNLDLMIKRKYDSHHISILCINNADTIKLYLDEFKITPFMAELDIRKNKKMTTALNHYLQYLNWKNNQPDILNIPTTVPEDVESSRSLSDVELEISILRKWHKDIPEELLNEYAMLKTK